MFYGCLFCILKSTFEQPKHFPDEQNGQIMKRSLQKRVENFCPTAIQILNFNFTTHPFLIFLEIYIYIYIFL